MNGRRILQHVQFCQISPLSIRLSENFRELDDIEAQITIVSGLLNFCWISMKSFEFCTSRDLLWKGDQLHVPFDDSLWGSAATRGSAAAWIPPSWSKSGTTSRARREPAGRPRSCFLSSCGADCCYRSTLGDYYFLVNMKKLKGWYEIMLTRGVTKWRKSNAGEKILVC